MTAMREQEQTEMEAQALAWWTRLRRSGMQPAELEAFGIWMAVPAHAQAYADCEWSAACIRALDRRRDPQLKAWKAQAMQRARDGAPKVEPLANWSDLVFAPTARAHRHPGSRFWHHAAALAACLGLVAVLLPWQRSTPATVLHYQAGNQTRDVLLPDGTRLTLDAGTAVDYTQNGRSRRLHLAAGRVYLQVAKNPAHPRFVVRSGGVETVVLGTRFQVSHNAYRTEVMLEEGKVRMQRLGTALSATLTPGERAWWQASAGEFRKAKASPSKALAWTRGRLLFEDTTLTDAVAEVNRYADGVQVELADPRVGQLRISGSFVAGDAELVVASWEAILPLRARHQGNRITLTLR